jgi:CelD/BcsL family acetyltransferase involved in cellulose biosynthesis
VRVADDVDRRAGRFFQLLPAAFHRVGELIVRERRQGVVAIRVEADGHARLGERPHLRSPDPGVVGIAACGLEQPLGGRVALLRGHQLQRQAKVVQRGRLARARRSGDDRREVGNARVERPLETLEVERERAIEGRTAEEERCRRAGIAQDRERDRRVTREVVVEGDRDREPPAASPRSCHLLETVGGHDLVVPEHVANLALEDLRFVRRHELTLRIARPLLHTVVHERDAGLPAGEPEQEHRGHGDRDAGNSREGPRDSFRERRMSAHTEQGSATEAEVVPRLELVDGFDVVEDEWNALAERSGGIFATALWSRAWWQHFGRGRELLLHVERSAGGGLVSVVPLYAWRRRLPRVLRFLGHGPGDELGLVHAAGDHRASAGTLRAVLEALEWNVCFAEQLPGDERWGDLLGGRAWRREASPVLRLPESWEEYLETRSSNFRQQLRRREQSLVREGHVELRLADTATLDGDLDALFALHRARWGRRRTDFSDTPFHREVAREALERGWLRLWLLELDGRPAGVWHGFQVGPVASYYQAGRDPAFDRLSVGFVLMAHTIRAAIAEGAAEYRFGRGDEAFKSRFASGDPGLETVVLSRGLVGRAAYSAARGARLMRGLTPR